MTREEDQPEVVTRRMEEALGSLANGTRLRIIQALLAGRREPMTFSALKAAVGVEDGGQFSYHLRKLTDRFVRHTDEGYELQYSGMALYHAMLAGIPFEADRTLEFGTGSECPACGAELRAAYDRDSFEIACGECDTVVHSVPYPVGGVEGRSTEEVLRAFDRRTRTVISQAVGGVCPWCSGPMTTELHFGDADDGAEAEAKTEAYDCLPAGHHVKHGCARCEGGLMTTVGEVLLTHPAVVSFYHERGVDVGSVPTWELEFCVTDRAVAVESTDPLRLRVTVECAGDTLELVVDERLSVLESAAPTA